MNREVKELMQHDAYERRRGALRQIRHVPVIVDAEGRPAHCTGCAWWHAMVRGGCLVFTSCLDPWLTPEGECEAWANAERRAEIEQAIRDYQRRCHQAY